MKQLQRAVIIGFAALVGVAPMASAQTSTADPKASGGVTINPNTNVSPSTNIGTERREQEASPRNDSRLYFRYENSGLASR